MSPLMVPSLRFRPRLKIKVPQLTFNFPRIVLPRPRLPLGLLYFFLGILATLIFFFIPYITYSWLTTLPNPRLLSHNSTPVTTKIYDRGGLLLYEIYAEQNRTPVPLEEIPKYLKEATIAIEDKDFYKHLGFSPPAIIRALKEIVINKKIQGGSTITQQLIRSALLTPEQTIERKIKEILLAFWAERIYGKDKILEMYFNQVPYGGTAWGVETASETYFGKKTKDLTLAEAAFLAGLPAAPSLYSPFGPDPKLSKMRQGEVLRRMVEDGYINSEESEKAKNENLTILPPRTEIKAPHFVMYVKSLLEKKYGTWRVEKGGLRVITSLDLRTQEMAQEIVQNEIEKLRPLSVGNGAVLITNPKNGQILGMVGSTDYFDTKNEGNVNVCLSLRQPGSAIKAVTYAGALENGFTAASILEDSPITYKIPGQPDYTPVNYDGRFHGLLPLRFALGNSYNVPAVKTLARIGLQKMIEMGKKMGVTSWEDSSRFGLSLTLGGGEVTMLEMAKIYGTLANGGIRQDLEPILKVTDYQDEVLEEVHPKFGLQAVSPPAAFILSDILADNNARSSAFGLISTLVIPGRSVSVKTGTSNEKRDNWTIGFTPSYVVAVWVGNNNNLPMDPSLTSGITGAAPIWHEIMVNLLKDKEDEKIAKPEGLVQAPCQGRMEYFISDTEKTGCPSWSFVTPTPIP